MTIPRTIVYIFIACFIIAVGLITHLFTRSHYEGKYMKETIAAKDSLFAAEQRARLAERLYLTSQIAAHKNEADGYVKQATSNKQYYETSKKKYDQIAIDVSKLSDDSLRSAYAEFR